MYTKRIRVLLLTFVVAVTMMAGSLSVFAADGEDAGPEVTKIVNVAQGVKVSETFTFTATQLSENPVTHTKPNEMVALSDVTISYSAEEADSTLEITKTGNFDISGITVPGEYLYEITETAGSTADWSYNTGEYKTYYLQVLVDQNGNKSYKMTTDPNFSADTGKKVDTMTFENDYTPKTDLVIGKKVTNPEYVKDQADGYTFVLTFTGNEMATAPTTVTGTKSDGTEVTYTVGDEFVLKQDETITFTDLPAGLIFECVETKPSDANYESTTIAINSYDTTAKDNTDKSVTGLDTGNQLLGAETGKNKAEFTNVFKEITVTGVIMNVLPYFMMIAVAGAAAAMYIASRRRRAARSPAVNPFYAEELTGVIDQIEHGKVERRRSSE